MTVGRENDKETLSRTDWWTPICEKLKEKHLEQFYDPLSETELRILKLEFQKCFSAYMDTSNLPIVDRACLDFYQEFDTVNFDDDNRGFVDL